MAFRVCSDLVAESTLAHRRARFDGSVDVDYRLNGLLFDRLLRQTLPWEEGDAHDAFCMPHRVDLGDAGARVAINVRKVTRQLDGSLLSKPRFVSLRYMSVEKFNFRHKDYIRRQLSPIR